MDFPERPDGRPAAAVGLKLPLPAQVLAVEKGGAGYAQPDWVGEVAMTVHMRSPQGGIERRACRAERRVQLRQRDLDNDARLDWIAGSIGELDVPVAVIFRLVDASYPTHHAEHLLLGGSSRGAPKSGAGSDLRRPPLEHRADRHRVRGVVEECRRGLGRPAIVAGIAGLRGAVR